MGRVSAEYFEQKFGTNVKGRFFEQWSHLEREGLGRWSGKVFELTRGALLKVDSLLHAFFLPHHQNSRYV